MSKGRIQNIPQQWIVYTKDNCPACKQLEHFCGWEGIEYTKMKVPQDIDAIDLVNRTNGIRSMPIIEDEDGNFFNWPDWKLMRELEQLEI